jgi:hypothetical protein
VALAVLVAVFVVSVAVSGRGRELRSLLELDDVLGGGSVSVDPTDAEWDRAGELAADIGWAALPWAVALTVIATVALVWASAICARVARRVHTGTVRDVSRTDDAGDALRRVPVMIAASIVTGLIGAGVAVVAFAPLGLAVAADAGGAAIAVAALFGLIGLAVAGVWLTGRLGLAVALAALGGRGLGLRRSWELTSTRFWSVLGRLAIIALVVASVTSPLGFVLNVWPWLGAVGWLIALAVLQVFTNVVTALVSLPAQVVLVRHLEEQRPTD